MLLHVIMFVSSIMCTVSAQEVPAISQRMIEEAVKKTLKQQQPILPLRIFHKINTAYDIGKVVLVSTAIGGVLYWYYLLPKEADVEKLEREGKKDAEEALGYQKQLFDNHLKAEKELNLFMYTEKTYLNNMHVGIEETRKNLEERNKELLQFKMNLSDTSFLELGIETTFSNLRKNIAGHAQKAQEAIQSNTAQSKQEIDSCLNEISNAISDNIQKSNALVKKSSERNLNNSVQQRNTQNISTSSSSTSSAVDNSSNSPRLRYTPSNRRFNSEW